MVSANKAILADAQAEPGWTVVRPPLRPLSSAATAELLDALASLQFSLRKSPVTA
jgi:hypothetical protein